MDEEADFLHPSPQQPLLYHQTSRPSQHVSRSTPRSTRQEGLSRVHHLSGSVQSSQTDESRDQLADVTFQLGRGLRCTFSSLCVVVALTVLTGIAQTGTSVSFVLFTSSLDRLYFGFVFATFWVTVILAACIAVARLVNPSFRLYCAVRHRDRVLIGFLNAISCLLIAYSAMPSRLPRFLNQLLSAAMIPLTALIRFIFLRKFVSCAAFTSAACVLIGLLISIEPVVFDSERALPGLHEWYNLSGHESVKWKAVWSVIFTAGICLTAVLFVAEERALKMSAQTGSREKTKEVNVLVFLAWIELWTFIFLACCFFSDIIPGFGQAGSMASFGSQMRDDFKCLFGTSPVARNGTPTHYFQKGVVTSFEEAALPSSDPQCHVTIACTWLFTLFVYFSSLFSLMLIKYADGALYVAIAQSLATPLSAIFWTLFKLDIQSNFSWQPVFNTSTIYVIVGFVLMLPSVSFYTRFWRRDMRM